MNKKKFTKLLVLYLPYVVIGLLATNLGEAWRLTTGKELGDKILSLMSTVLAAFANPLPSLHPFDLFVGLCCGAWMRLAVYLKGKNAKKYRHGMEYGSARWGTAKDIEPFMAPKFEDNIILTKTERLMMSNRPTDPKNARNKNVLIVGGYPFKDDDVKEKVKLTVLNKLNERYGMKETDFISAELCAVPAFKARDVGFDRSLIGGYGHDDRVCSYPAITALGESKDTLHTVVVVLADKEEIGSEGPSGMQCAIFSDLLDFLAASQGKPSSLVRLNSKCLSADVTAGYDPNFAGVFEKRNSSLVACGTALCKFTGAGGKSGSNDASAELVGYVRRVFDAAGVNWQMAELGKVDAGGGGTVAKYIAKLNIDTIDIGVPVISMHSPYEVISKADLYSTYEAFAAFID